MAIIVSIQKIPAPGAAPNSKRILKKRFRVRIMFFLSEVGQGNSGRTFSLS